MTASGPAQSEPQPADQEEPVFPKEIRLVRSRGAAPEFGDVAYVALGIALLAGIAGAMWYAIRYAYLNSDATSLVYAAVIATTVLIISGATKTSERVVVPTVIASFALPFGIWASLQGWGRWVHLGMVILVLAAVVALLRQERGSSTLRVAGGILTAVAGLLLFLATFTSRVLGAFGIEESRYKVLASDEFWAGLKEVVPLGPFLSVVFVALAIGFLSDLRRAVFGSRTRN